MKKLNMKRILALLLALAMCLALAACGDSGEKASDPGSSTTDPGSGTTEPGGDTNTPPAGEAPSGELVLYTSAGAAEYELIVDLFSKKYPDIDIEIVSGGTGDMASRIAAEKNAPYGDVMMGGGDTIYRGIQDCLEPYTSTEAGNLVGFVPEDNLYTPCYINVNAIIVNKTLIAKKGIEVTGWESLTDPALKGDIAFANPADAGSALEVIVNMLAAMNGTGNLEDGWDFVTKFVTNLDGKFASGSSAAYKSVVEGEYAVGLCNEDKVISYMKDGADVFAVYAKEGITLRPSNIALIRGGANPDNAKLFIDFVVSKECQTAMESELNVRPIRGDVPITTEGRVATADLIQLPYPEVSSSDLKTKFQDIVTSVS